MIKKSKLDYWLSAKMFIILLMLTILINSNFVNASETTHNADTQASIEFIENEGPTVPVDPEIPENPDPELPGVGGSLVIIHATDFNFNLANVSINREFYPIQTSQPNIQIADLRGKATGWKLEASLSPFTEDEDEEINSLPGASIRIADGRLNSSTPMQFAPTVSTDVKLTSDNEPTRILTAQKGYGTGLWVNRFYPDYNQNPNANAFVQLEVLAGTATTGKHNATITWTLHNAP